MKFIKILSVCILCLLLASTFTCFAEYNLDDYNNFAGGVGNVTMKNGSPTVDGNISDSEGYGSPITINSANSVSIWAPSSRVITTITARYAWDTNGIYVACDIVDPSLVKSTGEDDIDDTAMYGYNGDVCVIALDPAEEFYNAGIINECSTWYCVSLNSAGSFQCYRTQSDEGDVTGEVKGAASTTSNGWKFEMMIPWDTIIDDAESCSLGDVTLTRDQITANGTTSHAMIMYMDRAPYSGDFTVFTSQELEEGEIFTLSRNMTIPTTLRDGTDGWTNSGEKIKCYGIVLCAADTSGNYVETQAPETTELETTTTVATSAEETTKKDFSTTKSEEETTPVVVNNDEGGFPVWIIPVIVVIVAAVLVVVFVVLPKTKKK